MYGGFQSCARNPWQRRPRFALAVVFIHAGCRSGRFHSSGESRDHQVPRRHQVRATFCVHPSELMLRHFLFARCPFHNVLPWKIRFPFQRRQRRIRQALSEGFGHSGNQIVCGALGSSCGEKVRDHVGQGYGKISQCLCTSVFCNAETPCPRASCEVRVFECELSTHLARRI